MESTTGMEKIDELFDGESAFSKDFESNSNLKFEKFIADEANESGERVRARVKELKSLDSRSIGRVFNGKRFYYRSEVGEDHQKLFVNYNGNDVLIFDPNKFDESKLTSIESSSPSPDGEKVAVLYTRGGDEKLFYKIFNSSDGSLVEESKLALFATGIVWDFEGEGIYFNSNMGASEDLNEYKKLVYHRLGSGNEIDEVIFEANKNSYLTLESDIRGRFFTLSISEGLEFRQDLYLAEYRGEKKLDFKLFISREIEGDISPYISKEGELFLLSFYKSNFGDIIRFNFNDALNGNVAFSDYLEFVIYGSKDKLVSDYWIDRESDVFYVLLEDKTSSRISIFRLSDLSYKYDIKLEEGLFVSTLVGFDAEPGVLYFYGESYIHPSFTYKYNYISNSLEVIFKPSNFIVKKQLKTEAIEFKTHDGHTSYGFLLLPEGYNDGEIKKCIITGYGGFAINEVPYFGALSTAWVEEGNIYACVQIRGGAEQGEDWHINGMREHKENTFKDLYSFAEKLIELRYTKGEALGFMGGSNGGLTAGVAITQRPDLFGAVVSECALLDMLNFHKFGMGTTWRDEYGDPDIESERAWISKYDPLSNLSEGDYSSTLVINFKNDSRVDNMHGRRFSYKLAEVDKDSSDKFFWTLEDSGHVSSNIEFAAKLCGGIYDFFNRYLSK